MQASSKEASDPAPKGRKRSKSQYKAMMKGVMGHNKVESSKPPCSTEPTGAFAKIDHI